MSPTRYGRAKRNEKDSRTRDKSHRKQNFFRNLYIKDVVFIILSQSNKYHAKLAENLKDDLHKQCTELKLKDNPRVHLSHLDFPHIGGWTIIPLINELVNLHQYNSSWLFFLQDNTNVVLKKLMNTLDKYNENDEVWLGYALHDKEPTIIHHFAFYENPTHFKYPNIASGFAISTKLLQRLASILTQEKPLNTDFSIDNAHELALFIWNKGKGIPLKHEPTLCISPDPNCATFPERFHACGNLITKESIYFAVKTCAKFHNDRIPVVKSTWAQNTRRLQYFSDVHDATIPTVTLGIPNTEQGHCSKTIAIIKYISKELKNDKTIKWIVIADDDTILSIHRLQELLSCYDDKERIALGERYGYNVQGSQGYNYITGGGGIVFSRPLFEQLSLPGVCECPSVSSPDDMFLGICIARLGADITHSPLFHQARPMDYAKEYLQSQYPVSFHKHWMLDPIDIYKKWFVNDGEVKKYYLNHNEL